MGEDEQCVVVIFFVVVVCAASVLVVGSSRVRCVFVCCWLDCRCRGDGRGLGSRWLLGSDAYRVVFHRVSSHLVPVQEIKDQCGAVRHSRKLLQLFFRNFPRRCDWRLWNNSEREQQIRVFCEHRAEAPVSAVTPPRSTVIAHGCTRHTRKSVVQEERRHGGQRIHIQR